MSIQVPKTAATQIAAIFVSRMLPKRPAMTGVQNADAAKKEAIVSAIQTIYHNTVYRPLDFDLFCMENPISRCDASAF